MPDPGTDNEEKCPTNARGVGGGGVGTCCFDSNQNG